MIFRRVPCDTAALLSTLPVLLPGGKEGALLLHGFTGSPMELSGLGQRLHAAGLSVSIPRLPGHGTRGDDFLQTGWRDWLRAAVDAWADMSVRCKTVHVVGHSMGGILAVLLASRFPVGKLVLLAPALQASSPLLPLTPLVGLFVHRVRWPITGTRKVIDHDTEVLAREYWSWRFPAQLASVYRLQRMARQALRRVTAKTLVVVGRQDRTVPTSVTALVERRIGETNVRHLVLERATHQILAGDDGQRAIDAAAGWICGESVNNARSTVP
jgi:carboxylesterase